MLLIELHPEDGKCIIQVFIQAPLFTADASLSAVAANAAAIVEHCLLRNPSEGGIAKDIGLYDLLILASHKAKKKCQVVATSPYLLPDQSSSPDMYDVLELLVA